MPSSTSPRLPLPLSTPVTHLRGVGAERAALLEKLGIKSIDDLIHHAPRRYEDRRNIVPIRQLQLHTKAAVQGKIVALGVKRYSHGTKSVFKFILEDGTGRLHCQWWNLPYMEQYFRQGDEVLVYGEVRAMRPITIDHPETETIENGEDRSIHLARIAPIYPLTEGLSQRWLRGLIWHLLESFLPTVDEPWPPSQTPGLLSLRQAWRAIHFPEELDQAEPARQRLAFGELVALQKSIQLRRHNLEFKARSWRCAGDNHLIKPFLRNLGFTLTEAQTKVLREIRQDMGAEFPMRRLLQGDVGSGKTVVAACCALMALESGYDAALMAPTEILAAQHHRILASWLEPLGVRVHLLTGNHRIDSASSNFKSPNSNLTVGTHALLHGSFSPDRLGLVIIDEQHKFGVSQREALLRKGHHPHLLVMTATPIPRTLGLTLYGDLDISVIAALPPGRGEVKTFIRTAAQMPKVWEFIRAKLAEGRQAYVVYSRVEETGDGEVKAALAEASRIEKELTPFRVGVLHGRMPTEQKERIMMAFREKQVHLLVATTVVEVGLDVPNATIMLIQNAERFGLAQLHQLRGRIHRASQTAHCILAIEKATAEAKERLQILAETSDGFRIAEADLRLRGPGDFLGHEQSGHSPFRFADLTRDANLAEKAREFVKTTRALEAG